MNLKSIKDNIQDGVCRVYHSTKAADLDEIIKQGKFNSGAGYGGMIGYGFYCNLQLRQAMKGNYGGNILMAEVKHLNKFIILVWESFNRAFPGVSDEEHFIDYQANKFGCTLKWEYTWNNYQPSRRELKIRTRTGNVEALSNEVYRNEYERRGKSSAQYAKDLNTAGIRSKCKVKPVGFIYRGDFDGLSMVCWYPDLYINPIKYSTDLGKTWKDVKDDSFASSVEEKSKQVAERGFNKQDEILRSVQRAEDLKEKYRHSGSDVYRAILAQLKKIKNKDKFEIRRAAFAKVFPTLSDRVMNIEFE